MKQIDTILLVKDINKSKDFYLTHFQLSILYDWKSMVIFTNRLALHQADLVYPQEKLKNHIKLEGLGSGNVIVYLETKDIDSAYLEMKDKGIDIIHEIVTFPWNNDRIFRIKDLDGHIIEIGEDKERQDEYMENQV